MTDTVNVPLDVIQRAVVMAKAIMKAEPLYGCVGYHGDEQINGHVEEAADLACLVLDEMADPVPAPNALAAAPKAEPVSDHYKLDAGSRADIHPHDLAGFIEQIQSDDVLVCGGRTIHAENLLAMAGRALRAQPEAQKGEQEPVAWRGRISETSSVWDYRNFDMTGEIWPIVEPLYTHPAPASDELLEALEQKLKEYEWRIAGSVIEEALDLIANHKGPQS